MDVGCPGRRDPVPRDSLYSSFHWVNGLVDGLSVPRGSTLNAPCSQLGVFELSSSRCLARLVRYPDVATMDPLIRRSRLDQIQNCQSYINHQCISLPSSVGRTTKNRRSQADLRSRPSPAAIHLRAAERPCSGHRVQSARRGRGSPP
jgi:hypothetical protein